MNTLQTSKAGPCYEALNLCYLHTISGGDKAFEKDVLQSLLSEMSVKMAALAAALEQSDVKTIRLQSHSLKNLAGIIGVPSLSERFREVEASCEEEPNVSIFQTFSFCEGQWAYSKGLLVQLLNEYE